MADPLFGPPDPSLPLTIQQLAVAERKILPPSRDCQYVYVKKGRVFRRDSTGIHTLGLRTSFLIPPGIGTSLIVNPEGEGLRVIFGSSFLDQMAVACWDEQRTDSLCRSLVLEGREIVEVTLAESATEHLERSLDRIIEESLKKATAFRSLIRLAFIDVLITVCRQREGEFEPFSAMGGWEAICEYIQENYTEAFSLTDLAERCGLNPSYFSRAFKEATGHSPFAYIHQIRIQKACQLLKRSDSPILDVAFAVGYNNISFFNRYFRKIMKMSPREYRQYAQS